jgi:copper transport protein
MLRRRLRRIARLLAVLAVAGWLLIADAPAAFAHAALEHSSPASGAVLQRAPATVLLTFGENVGVTSGEIEVFDDRLRRVDHHDAGHLTGAGDTVGVRLDSGLHRGTYTVTWRVVSADSHPISGGYTFAVGAPSTVVGTPPSLSGGHSSVGILLGTMRLLGYLGLIAGPGALIFFVMWPAGRTRQLVRRLIVVGVLAGIVSTAGEFALQAPYAAGESLRHLFDSGLLSGVAHTHFGKVLLIRLALWLALAVASAHWFIGRRYAPWSVGAMVLALPVTWATVGHGDVGRQVPLSIASESLHVLAVTTWLGGLTVLSLAVLRRATRTEALAVLPRFSTVALSCFAIITATGLYQAWREIDLSWTALVTTTYGRLVIAKIAGLVALFGLGAFARWVLRGAFRTSSTAAPDAPLPMRALLLPHLRRSVLVELAVGLAVLIFTSILVNTIPANEAVDRSVHRTLNATGLQVEITVTPGREGPDTVSLIATDGDGHPEPIEAASGSLNLPSRRISSLPVTFATTKGSDEAISGTSFALPGEWTLTFEVQTSPTDATQFTTSFRIY